MKKSLVALAVLVLVAGLSTSAFAERWGKPGANLEKGQWSLGLEYSYMEAERDLSVPKALIVAPGLGDETQIQLNQLMVRVGHGLTDKVEAFIKMGGTSTDVTDVFMDPTFTLNDHMEGNLDFTIAGGLKCTLLEEGDFRLGAIGQFEYRTLDDRHQGEDLRQVPLNQYIEGDVFKFEGALLASYEMGKITPYGGICMSISDADMTFHAYDPGLFTWYYLDIDADQEDWFGMVVGVNCEVMENVRVGVELTCVSEGVGVSTGVNCAL